MDEAAAAGPAVPAEGMAARVGRAKAASVGPWAIPHSHSLQIEGPAARAPEIAPEIRFLLIEGPAARAPEIAPEIRFLLIEGPAARAPSSQAFSAREPHAGRARAC